MEDERRLTMSAASTMERLRFASFGFDIAAFWWPRRRRLLDQDEGRLPPSFGGGGVQVLPSPLLDAGVEVGDTRKSLTTLPWVVLFMMVLES